MKKDQEIFDRVAKHEGVLRGIAEDSNLSFNPDAYGCNNS